MTDLLEKAASDMVKTATDVAKIGLALAETSIKKAWTLAEAAVEKQSPSEYLSPQAICAIQSKPEQ